MKPYLRAFPVILALLLCTPELFWAQTKKHRPVAKPTLAAEGAGGTVAKKDPGTTEDDIAKLSAGKSSKQEHTLVAKTTEAPTANPEKARVEIMRLRQELKDRQRRLELLMTMFITDEQKFIRDPTKDFDENDDLQLKCRYEQEELKRETAEIGQLKSRLEMLTKMVEE